MNKVLNSVVDENCGGERLDVAVVELFGNFSRSAAKKLIESGNVSVDGEIAPKASRLVKTGETVAVICPEPVKTDIPAQDIPLDIVFQNSSLLVINKQQGISVHPSNGIYEGTLVNALLFHVSDLSGINGELRPGIVHRLDKDTSGLMLVAKNDVAHRALAEQIASKTCKRIYYALLEGVVKEDSGNVDQPIGRSKTDRKKMAIDPNGRSAVTNFEVLQRYEKNTLVKFELKTGRTHQIRVHAKFTGHPVVGDKTYGFKNQRFKLDGQLLHSKQIGFTDPETGNALSFDSPLPQCFERVLKILENEKI